MPARGLLDQRDDGSPTARARYASVLKLRTAPKREDCTQAATPPRAPHTFFTRILK
jgi:hypothetical protein